MKALYKWSVEDHAGCLFVEGHHEHDLIMGVCNTPEQLEKTIQGFQAYDTTLGNGEHLGAINEADVTAIRAAVMSYMSDGVK
jgi:hypothetical protein